jgi:hypothetical protein
MGRDVGQQSDGLPILQINSLIRNVEVSCSFGWDNICYGCWFIDELVHFWPSAWIYYYVIKTIQPFYKIWVYFIDFNTDISPYVKKNTTVCFLDV